MLAGFKATEKSVDNDACALQLREQRERWWPRFARRMSSAVQIRPRRRNKRASAVRQNEHEVQRTPTMRARQHLQRLSFERVTRTYDRHLLGTPAVVLVVMGIVSCRSSTG